MKKEICQLACYQREDYSTEKAPAVFSQQSYRNMYGLSGGSLHRNDYLIENMCLIPTGPVSHKPRPKG